MENLNSLLFSKNKKWSWRLCNAYSQLEIIIFFISILFLYIQFIDKIHFLQQKIIEIKPECEQKILF